MCGRYAATKDPARLAVEFGAAANTAGQAPGADHNVAPSKNVVTVVQRHPRDSDGTVLDDEPALRSLRVMRWGLVPFWAKDPSVGNRMINTRAETATEKPAFRKALARRRCLLPADGWFEWRSTPAAANGARTTKARKDPYFMTAPGDESLAFAGIWESWRDPVTPDTAPLITCSVLTTDAVGQLAGIHHRMPLLMPRSQWSDWLDPDFSDTNALGELLRPTARDLVDSLELRPVSTKVNNVRNNGAELVERAEPDPVSLPVDDADADALFELPGT